MIDRTIFFILCDEVKDNKYQDLRIYNLIFV